MAKFLDFLFIGTFLALCSASTVAAHMVSYSDLAAIRIQEESQKEVTNTFFLDF
ncbi:MAG: hypothetical protein ACETWD_10540 [Desulfatiglandales bacterium]